MKFKVIANEHTPKVENFHPAQVLIKTQFDLLNKFITFTRLRHGCAGLAANQVSCNNVRITENFFVFKENHYWQMVINPKIIKYQGKEEEKIERCLTWIGKTIEVMRYPIIDVSYTDLKGDVYNRTLDGFSAQVFQHEYDHLNGVEEKFHSYIL